MSRLSALAAHPRRTLGALAVVLAAVGITVGSGANFTAHSANPANTFTAGTLTIGNSALERDPERRATSSPATSPPAPSTSRTPAASPARSRSRPRTRSTPTASSASSTSRSRTAASTAARPRPSCSTGTSVVYNGKANAITTTALGSFAANGQAPLPVLGDDAHDDRQHVPGQDRLGRVRLGRRRLAPIRPPTTPPAAPPARRRRPGRPTVPGRPPALCRRSGGAHRCLPRPLPRPLRRLRGLGGGLLTAAAVALAAAVLLPALLGFQRYVITSGSMTGTYDRGSLVYDRVVPTSSLKVGDVITYDPPRGRRPRRPGHPPHPRDHDGPRRPPRVPDEGRLQPLGRPLDLHAAATARRPRSPSTFPTSASPSPPSPTARSAC